MGATRIRTFGDAMAATLPDRWREYGEHPPCMVAGDVWRAACALAAHRHPNAIYPQPSDLADARIAVAAAHSLPAGVMPRPVRFIEMLGRIG